jgi:hypothetical protein
MRFKPLKRLGLILSLSKDEDTFSGFFSILLGQNPWKRAFSADLAPFCFFHLAFPWAATAAAARATSSGSPR